MKTNLQSNGHLEIQETAGKVHTSQGLVLTGSKAEEFKRMALEVVEGNNEVIKMLDDLEEEKEKRLKEEKEEKEKLEVVIETLKKSKDSELAKLGKYIIKMNDINSKDGLGRTALILASCLGRNKIIELLIKNNADINEKDKDKCTALMYAVGNGKMQSTKILLENGAKVNETDNNGDTALIYADNQKMRDLLISYGAIE